MRSLRRRSLRAKIGGVAVSAIALFIISTAIAGIIGNRADTLFVLLWGIVSSSATSDSWPWIIVLILLIVLSVVAGFWNHTRSNLRITNQMADLDDKLLKFIPILISAGDLEEEMDRLTRKLLERATIVFDGEVNRASLFLPDPDRKFLRMRHSYQISHETVKRIVFDIETGKPKCKERDSRRGIFRSSWSASCCTYEAPKWPMGI